MYSRSTGKRDEYKVTSDEPRNSARDNGPEAKASKAMLKGMDSLSFDHWKFAVPIVLAPIAVRVRFLQVILTVLDMWAKVYDEDAWEDDIELSFLTEVKQIQAALEPFRAE